MATLSGKMGLVLRAVSVGKIHVFVLLFSGRLLRSGSNSSTMLVDAVFRRMFRVSVAKKEKNASAAVSETLYQRNAVLPCFLSACEIWKVSNLSRQEHQK